MSSWPLLALCGSRTTTRKSSDGGSRELGLEDVDDLRRPQELVLEVDQVPGAAQRADVGLEHRELAARQHAVGALGHGADELHGRVAGGRRCPRAARSAWPAVASQRRAKCAATSRTIGPRRQAGRVVPADLVRLVRVLVGVVAVAGQRGQVDAADERQLVVDDHELLVVAVHHPRAGVELALDLRAAHEPLARGLDARRGAAGTRAPARPPTRSPAPARARRSRPAAPRTGRRRARAGIEVGLAGATSRRGRGASRRGSPPPSAAARSRRRSGSRASCRRAAARRSAPTGPRVAGASAASWPCRRRRRRW